MQIVTTDEARVSLMELLTQVRTGPVFIRDGQCDVAVLVSPEDFDQAQLAKVKAFERSRDAMALELATNLARDNMSVDEFVRDLLA